MGKTKETEQSLLITDSEVSAVTTELREVGEEKYMQLSSPTPMTLLQMAVSQGADIDKLAKLMELQERWEANEARKEYGVAFTAFKKNPPEIIKNKLVAFKDVKYKHATLDNVVEKVGEALSLHGLSHRWKTEQVGGTIRVTCILSKGVHSETFTLEGPPDNTGSKNAIQAISSTVSYLERYTLLGVTGLATSDMDDDGHGGEDNAPKMDDLQERCEWIANCRDEAELKKIFLVAYDIADKAKDKNAMTTLIAAKNARYKELRNANG